MAAFNKFNCFVADLANKVHNLGSDTLTIALTASANAPVVGSTTLPTQIAYTNCSPRVVTITGSTQTSGAYSLVGTDLTLTASGGAIAAFRYVILYNATAVSSNLIGWWDYTSDVTILTGETFLINFDTTILTLS